jgi:hypothetical protein
MWIAIWLFSQCYEEMKVAGIQVSKQSIYGAYWCICNMWEIWEGQTGKQYVDSLYSHIFSI